MSKEPIINPMPYRFSYKLNFTDAGNAVTPQMFVNVLIREVDDLEPFMGRDPGLINRRLDALCRMYDKWGIDNEGNTVSKAVWEVLRYRQDCANGKMQRFRFRDVLVGHCVNEVGEVPF